MKWFLGYFGSSIGKKQTMACAGLLLTGFLAGHAAGNLQLLHPDALVAQAHYNAYAKFLMGLVPYLWLIEAALLALLAVHVCVAFVLKLENRAAAGASRYAVSARTCSPASTTMFLTGCVVFVFLVQHLYFFKFSGDWLYRDAGGALVRDVWLTVVLAFANPCWTAFYALAMLALGFHLVHALPSLLRTFGVSHEKWNPLLALAGHAAGAALALVFALTALGTCALSHTPSARAAVARALAAQEQLHAANAAAQEQAR